MAREKQAGGITFEQLMALGERPVLRVCYRLLGNLEDAQDAAQEVLMKAYDNLAKFEEGRDPLPWLYRVSVNLCRDRRRRARGTAPLEAGAEAREAGADPEQQAGVEERKRLLLAGLAELGERERTALVLRELEGLDTRDVARILQVTEETVRSQCSNARAKLRQYLEGRNAR